MKRLLVSPLLAALLLFSNGCVSTPQGPVPNVPLMCSVAKNATYIGSTYWLKSHPQDREKFELARKSITTLIAAGSFDTAALTTALQNLPIRELQGDTGVLIIGGAIELWDVYGRELGKLDQGKVFETYILPVAQSILTGLDLALAPPKT